MYCNKVTMMMMMMMMMMMTMTMMMMMIMMMIIIIIVIIAWLQVWRIRLEVTNNLETDLSYYQASSLKKKSVDLILVLSLGHERYAVLSDIINKLSRSRIRI